MACHSDTHAWLCLNTTPVRGIEDQADQSRTLVSLQRQDTDDMKSWQAYQSQFSYHLSEPQVILFLGGAEEEGQIENAGGKEENHPIKKKISMKPIEKKSQ